MASAELIFKTRNTLETTQGKPIAISMDLYKLPEPFDPTYPDGYRFSWIAYEDKEPSNRVLFDCHSPKGPHMHIDGDKEGVRFKWESVAQARSLFFKTVVDRFGFIPELEGEY
jgi:hypothetical protein